MVNAPIEFDRIVVHYGNGQAETLHVRDVIAPGGHTRAIPLQGDRFVQSFELWYAKANPNSSKPEVTSFRPPLLRAHRQPFEILNDRPSPPFSSLDSELVFVVKNIEAAPPSAGFRGWETTNCFLPLLPGYLLDFAYGLRDDAPVREKEALCHIICIKSHTPVKAGRL